MAAIASLEDLKAAQKDLLEAKNLERLKAAFRRWRKIEERTQTLAPGADTRTVEGGSRRVRS